MIWEDRLTTIGLPRYMLDGNALEYGASFGNAHSWLTTRGNGGIHQFFSVDTGMVITGNVAVAYGGAGHHILRGSESQRATFYTGTDVQLVPIAAGTVEVHPAFQRRAIDLPENLHVEETVFLPLTSDDDPATAYYTTEVTNRGSEARRIEVFGFARLGGSSSVRIAAHYDPDLRGLVAASVDSPDAVRIFGSTEAVTAYETNLDYGRVYDVYHVSRLHDDTSASGDIIGALQISLYLEPDESRRVTFLLAFSPDGPEAAVDTYNSMQDAQAALKQTIRYLVDATTIAQVLTPDAEINKGVLWSKINMLRVRAHYPKGHAFTNDPGVSTNVVARDAAWFVYGGDHFMPDLSRNMLDTFAGLQYESGKIPEFYDALTGRVDDYGLNINDDTPLFILAVNHHFRATGDMTWLRDIYPSVIRAARYIVSQCDQRDLVYCSADDPRGNVFAICGWRNVIPDYSINGAVTELNAECVAALRAAGHLAENVGSPPAEAQEFFGCSDQIREAMNRHLINPSNGLYFLTIDVHGIARTDVTGDQVFPVMFRACPEEVGFRIIRRLNHPDFWTSAGLRTASCNDPLYDPARNLGLQGGVWPGLTWWYAFAAARYRPELMVHALKASFSHYASEPKKNNTVPGQFSEWFDGESLVNRGMRLSPWEPPRFLWAAIEGVCGVILQPNQVKIRPLVPATWQWVALRHLAYHGRDITFFATREGAGRPFRIYATTAVDGEDEVEIFDEDVSEKVRVLDPAVIHVALRRAGRTVLLLGQTGSTTSTVPIELGDLVAHAAIRVHLYDSEAFVWRSGLFEPGLPDNGFSLTIESGGFRLLSFETSEHESQSQQPHG